MGGSLVRAQQRCHDVCWTVQSLQLKFGSQQRDGFRGICRSDLASRVWPAATLRRHVTYEHDMSVVARFNFSISREDCMRLLALACKRLFQAKSLTGAR